MCIMNYKTISIIGFSLLTACMGNQVKDTNTIEQSALAQAQDIASQQDPSDIIESARELQVKAQKEDLYFFSPTYMSQAEDAMSEAESALAAKKPAQETIALALTAQKLFSRGLESKQSVRIQLEKSFSGLDMLKTLGTPTVERKEYESLMDDLKDLIVLIEQGKTSEAASEETSFLKDIAELEITTLKTKHLSPVQSALDLADEADADDFAPKSLKEALNRHDALQSYIESSPKDRDGIRKKSTAAIKLAQHAEHVAKSAKPLLKLNPELAETHVLQIEAWIRRIGQSLEHEDVTHLELNSQSIALAQKAETLTKQAKAVGERTQWDNERVKLQADIARLQQEVEQLTGQLKTHNSQSPDSDIQHDESTTSDQPLSAIEQIQEAADTTQTALSQDENTSETDPNGSSQASNEVTPQTTEDEAKPDPASQTQVPSSVQNEEENETRTERTTDTSPLSPATE